MYNYDFFGEQISKKKQQLQLCLLEHIPHPAKTFKKCLDPFSAASEWIRNNNSEY